MIDCGEFYAQLGREGVEFFAGVPDSLLKDICGYISDHAPAARHIIAANEGAAVALAAGHHLATGAVGLVYMQNSGLGNAVNPLTSLTDPKVYSIPMLLLIGWRGEPGVPDEPQHLKQGEITLALLETLGISHAVLPPEPKAAATALSNAVAAARAQSAPFAIVVKKGTFAPYKLKKTRPDEQEMTREQAITSILDALGDQAVIVSTTGMASREVYEYRARTGSGAGRDFLTVGSMGHASQIALSIALARPDREVCCIDGDGAVIMHMGSLAISGAQPAGNFKHIVLNNGAHDSVGGQPTAGLAIDLPQIALGCGYRNAARVRTAAELQEVLAGLREKQGPVLMEVLVNKGARADLGRPKSTPAENKRAFMRTLAE